MAILNDGSLYAWGQNGEGQLGDGTTTERQLPVKVLYNVKAVACGAGHTMAILNDGSLYAWGWNGNGQLGDNTTTDRLRPVKTEDNVAEVTCGYLFTAYITESGDFKTVGEIFWGEQ